MNNKETASTEAVFIFALIHELIISASVAKKIIEKALLLILLTRKNVCCNRFKKQKTAPFLKQFCYFKNR